MSTADQFRELLEEPRALHLGPRCGMICFKDGSYLHLPYEPGSVRRRRAEILAGEPTLESRPCLDVLCCSASAPAPPEQ